MNDPDYERMGRVMIEKNWVAWINPHKLWAVGIEVAGGDINVLGLGRTVAEAFNMAERSTGI